MDAYSELFCQHLVDHCYRFDESILPDCPPSGIHPKDLSRAIGNTREEVDALGIPRYYLSELIGLNRSEELPFHLLRQPTKDLISHTVEEYREFITYIFSLAEGSDECDRVGIMYIASFLRAYLESKSDLWCKFSVDFTWLVEHMINDRGAFSKNDHNQVLYFARKLNNL